MPPKSVRKRVLTELRTATAAAASGCLEQSLLLQVYPIILEERTSLIAISVFHEMSEEIFSAQKEPFS